MKKVIHRAETRGYANQGWLKTHYTFSFANYYDPNRMHFGVLRVLNDEKVAPSEGFDTHSDDNMEIISILLEGELKYWDSMGSEQILRAGELRVISAGTGMMHSEVNASDTEPVKLLQIWIFTNAKAHRPCCDKVTPAPVVRNSLRLIVAPQRYGSENVGWVYQDAWLHTLDLDQGFEVEYSVKKPAHGVYIFVIAGGVEVADERLEKRDGMGISEVETFKITGTTDARVLIIEVPMCK